MTTAMEKAKWAKEKQPVIQEYIDGRRKLVSATAGRGFLLAPGLLYEYETGLEIDTKQKLSALSSKILNEAIDRDIKQAGLDYDLAYKTASMTWELDKQSLLDAWDREMAGIKNVWAMQEGAMDQLAVEVSRRGTILINAKTAIELESEALKAQLAGIENNATDYEVQLVQQKVVTANRKLAVIPILQQILLVEQSILLKEYAIIAKERLLSDKEREKIQYLSGLVEKELDVADKKSTELLPAMNDLIGVSRELADAIREQLVFEIQIMAQKVIDAGIMVQKAEMQIEIALTQIEEETARLELMDAKLALSEALRAHELAILKLETQLLWAEAAADDSAHDTIMNQERLTQSNVVNEKTDMAETKIDQEKLSTDTIIDKHIQVTNDSAAADFIATIQVATINAGAELTSQLTHLIG